MAKLYFKYGTMSSAKTALLLINAHQFQERNIPFICLKPSVDNRDGDSVIKSRVGIQRECVMIDTNTNIFECIKIHTEVMLASLREKVRCVLIDECQFLTPEQVDQLAKVVDDLDVDVMCFGLKTDFQTKLFDGSKRLFEICDDFEEIKTRCACGKKASINARIDIDGNIISDGEQIVIGGDDKYMPMCRKCFLKKKKVNFN